MVKLELVLSEKPRHGYELMKEQQLEDEGRIVSETKDGKRCTSSPSSGRQDLQRESATAEDIWRRTSDWGDWGEWIVGLRFAR
jgi:hypothetical protein